MRAVYADDEETFDQVWGWTQENLQVRPNDNLLTWQWGPNSGVIEDFAATDAEEDAALALLFASKRWDDSGYEDDARTLLDSIWEEETAEVGGRRVLTAGDWADDNPGSVVVNPSYFAPYAYRIFDEVDPSRDWSQANRLLLRRARPDRGVPRVRRRLRPAAGLGHARPRDRRGISRG